LSGPDRSGSVPFAGARYVCEVKSRECANSAEPAAAGYPGRAALL